MRYDRKRLVNAFFLLVFFGSLLFAVVFTFLTARQPSDTPDVTAKKAGSAFGLEDKDIWLYLEVITRVKEDALFVGPGTAREDIVRDSLKAYLAQKDRFSDYLTREEYKNFKESQLDTYVGVGMEIEKDGDGKIICVPYPKGPAEAAGISPGDQLKSLNGTPVDGKSLFTIASMAKGKPGTTVDLVVLTESGIQKQTKVTRAHITVEAITKQRLGKRPVIQISSFVRNTRRKLRTILDGWKAEDPIIIDLRSNAGGDLHAAIDSTMLLLGEGKRVVSIETRKGSKTYVSVGGATNLTSPIYLWQNEGTASAAEVFVAALTENHRAVSIGKRTFGKGTIQDILELSDGSALVLTTGELQTPNGVRYQGYGLTPTYPVNDTGDTASRYMEKVEELIRVKGNSPPTPVSDSALGNETSNGQSGDVPRK